LLLKLLIIILLLPVIIIELSFNPINLLFNPLSIFIVFIINSHLFLLLQLPQLVFILTQLINLVFNLLSLIEIFILNSSTFLLLKTFDLLLEIVVAVLVVTMHIDVLLLLIVPMSSRVIRYLMVINPKHLQFDKSNLIKQVVLVHMALMEHELHILTTVINIYTFQFSGLIVASLVVIELQIT